MLIQFFSVSSSPPELSWINNREAWHADLQATLPVLCGVQVSCPMYFVRGTKLHQPAVN